MSSFSGIDDGYIRGELNPNPVACERCGKRTRCIHIFTVEMPAGVSVEATILWSKQREDVIEQIGLGCCYGKLHRQLVHIQGPRRR